MRYNTLGKTGIKVSELCFGVLPMGPLQADVPVDEGAEVLAEAMRSGVTYYDTAEMYRTYPYLKKAIDATGKKYDIVIGSKSTAESYADMQKAVEDALRALERDYIDIFLLHAARVPGDPREVRAGAWECLQDMKTKGYIRACGVSTHVVPTASVLAEGGTDILFPIYNNAGIGVINGTMAEMREAVEKAAARGIGCLSMKLLGGGNLLHDYLNAIAFGREVDAFAAHAIGMVRMSELKLNVRVFNDEAIDRREVRDLKSTKQMMFFRALCKRCGHCATRCPNFAIKMMNGQPEFDRSKCLLCGYCADACPEFAIRVR